jgi:hypothetical protein
MIVSCPPPERTARVSWDLRLEGLRLELTAVYLWKIEDSLFEGWGEDGWAPEDLTPVGKLNAGGR